MVGTNHIFPYPRLPADRRQGVLPPGDPPAVLGALPHHVIDDLSALAAMLREGIRYAEIDPGSRDGRRAVLDSFLCAAATWQVAEDLSDADAPGGGSRVAVSAAHLAILAGLLAAELGRHVAGLPARDPATWERLRYRARRAANVVAMAPEPLRRAIAFPPACFARMDQRPEDVGVLAEEFAARRPDRRRRLTVIGARTSGSYLAPLLVGHLRRLGYRDVDLCTWRAGQPVNAARRRPLASVVATNGLALLVGDAYPDQRGGVHSVAVELERLGLPPEALWLLLGSTEDGEVRPAKPAGCRQVVLPFRRWAVWGLLREDAVAAALRTLLVGRSLLLAGEEAVGPRVHVRGIVRAQRLFEGSGSPIGRARAVFLVDVLDENGMHHPHHVLVGGTGVGRLGDRPADGEEPAGGDGPQVYGHLDGLRYRTWLPSRLLDGAMSLWTPVDPAPPEAPAAPDQRGRREEPWARLAAWASVPYGRLAPLVLPTLGRAGLRLLGTPPLGADGRPAAGVAELAASAGDGRDPDLEERLRTTYERLAGEELGEERWFLHRLLHLLDAPLDVDRERALSRAHERYLGAAFLGDLEPPATGRLAAIAVDGVLETTWPSYPATTPAGALALRALTRHGFRPVLVSGRSLAEVRERCAAYGLAGGVAEHGAAAYDLLGDRSLSLLDPDQRSRLEGVGAELAREAGVALDPDCEDSVRAWRADGNARRGLEPDLVARVLDRAGARGLVRGIAGPESTDFVAEGVDLARGLRALAGLLGERADGAFLSFAAIGAASELPVVACSTLTCAPASAEPAVRERARHEVLVTSRPHQAGLLQGVHRLLGHSPWTCRTCGGLRHPAERRLLLAVLGAADRGPAGRVLQGLEVALRASMPE